MRRKPFHISHLILEDIIWDGEQTTEACNSEPSHSPLIRIHGDENSIVAWVGLVPIRITANDLTTHTMWPRQFARGMEDNCSTLMNAELRARGDMRKVVEMKVLLVVAVREEASMKEMGHIVVQMRAVKLKSEIVEMNQSCGRT